MTRAGWIALALTAAGCGADESVPADSAPSDADAIDAPTIDAPTIDAHAIDAMLDLDAPADAPTVNPTAALVPDPDFSTDGSEVFVGITRMGDVATAGPRIGLCARIWSSDQGQLFSVGFFGYRTRPGAAENLFGSQYAMPPANQYPRGCAATALFPDGTGVFATNHGGLPARHTQLVRRDAAGMLSPGVPAPSTEVVRGMHALAGNRVVELFDDAAWVLDASLQPVLTVGNGGEIALPAPPVASLVRSLGGPRLDVVTATSMIRFDLATGARDATFGNGGEVSFPGAPFTVRGVVPLAAGRTLVVGNATGVELDAAGGATRVTLPAITPIAVVEDRAGGAYLVTRSGVTFALTQIARTAPTVWTAGTVSTITPTDLCAGGVCVDGALPSAVARWTVDDRLAIGVTLTYRIPNDFRYSERAALLVVKRP